MKKIGIVVPSLVVLLAVIQADAEMRPFTLTDGRALEAEIVGYNAKLGQVEIQRPDGKRVSVDPKIFEEPDRHYIQHWAALDGFRNASVFRVDCKKDRVEDWKEEDTFQQKKFQRYVYEITIDNRCEGPVENLKAEYRIFYEQESNERGGKISNAELILPGTLDIDRLGTKEKRMFKSESVVLIESRFNLTDYYVQGGDPQSANGDIKGIWIRLTSSTPDGMSATREIFEPAGLEGKYTWPVTVAPPPKEKKKGKKK